MRKLLSVIMAILFIISNYGVKGCSTILLPDGGKKITYRYEDLPQLISQHGQLLNQVRTLIDAKKRTCPNMAPLSMVSVLCIIVGTVFVSHTKDKSVGKSILPGMVLYALGAALIGVPYYLNKTICDLQNQERAIDTRISAINTARESIASSISHNIITEDEASRSFFYSLFVDRYGYVYKVETGGAVPYFLFELPSDLRYKLDR